MCVYACMYVVAPPLIDKVSSITTALFEAVKSLKLNTGVGIKDTFLDSKVLISGHMYHMF